MADLPEGTLTFLLTDVEGSTQLWERDAPSMRSALEEHDRILYGCVDTHRGRLVEAGREGDSILAVFPSGRDAALCALAMQERLAAGKWPDGAPLHVRIALHTGEASLRSGHYYGRALNRCARLLAAGHGGQVLLSGVTAALVAEEPPQGCELRDLGLHRLRDLLQPEHVFQLSDGSGEAVFPPVVSLTPRKTNLPFLLTELIGREVEVDALTSLLRETRLVTVTGAGGSGKTRLALQAAAEMVEDEPDGVWFADLSTLSDPALVPDVVASALEVEVKRSRAVLDTVLEAAADRRLLLVLDNCEHLVGACASFVAALLHRSPGTKVLATSREPLRVPGERTWPLHPLTSDAAVQLFVERAVAVAPGFTLEQSNQEAVTSLCARLDGLPLAIELAAARVPIMEPSEIFQRLERRFALLTSGSRAGAARQRTLRATIDWGHDLLTEPEKTLFRRLSVFAGAFSIDASERVCSGQRLAPEEVVGLLADLASKSMVVADEGRFRYLDTIRAYARERLEEAGELDAMRARHAGWLLELARSRRAGQTAEWLDVVEVVRDDLRAALGWAADAAPETGLEIAEALRSWWQIRGYAAEARQFLDRLLPLASETEAYRACLPQLAGYAYDQADFEAAHDYAERAIALSRSAGDWPNLIRALDMRALLCTVEGHFELSQPAVEEALAIAQRIGDDELEAESHYQLGLLFSQAGDQRRATVELGLAVELFGRAGRGDQGAAALVFLGMTKVIGGELEPARSHLLQGLKIARRLGDRRAAWGLDALACLEAVEGRAERALKLAGAAAAMFRVSGTTPAPAWAAVVERGLKPARLALGEAAGAAYEAGSRLVFEAAIDFAVEQPRETNPSPA